MSKIADDLRATGLAQVIVVLKPGAAAAPPAALSKHFVQSELSQNSALMSAGLAAGPHGRAGARRATAQREPEAPASRYYPHLGIMLGTVDRDGLSRLRAETNHVASIHGSPVISLIRPRRVAAATLTRRVTWGIEKLEVPQLWSEGLSGQGVLVGHLDTGADGRHPALRTAIAHFAEFDLLGNPVNPAPAAHDTDEHGTHTAATIAGRAVRGKAVGMAPRAHLASAIVIEGGNVIARILGGMDWALGQGVRVLSMSLGFRGMVQDFLPITQILRAQNVLPAFAVGNEGPGTSRSPGNYSEALSVGASDQGDLVADFSSSQRFRRKRDPLVPDLLAPGVGVISAKPGGGFQAMDGTSMATPHIAGLAALLLEARPSASASEVEKAIFKSCNPAGIVAPDRSSRGIPNGPRALAILLGRRSLAKLLKAGTPRRETAPPARTTRTHAGMAAAGARTSRGGQTGRKRETVKVR